MGSMKPILLLAIVALMAADPAAGETHNQKLERLLKTAKASADEKIVELKESTKSLTAELKRLPRAKIVSESAQPPKTFLSQKDKDEYIAKQKAKLAEDTAELKRLKDGAILIPTIETPLLVGKIGYWSAPWFNAERVISPTEVICSAAPTDFSPRHADCRDGRRQNRSPGHGGVRSDGTYTYQTERYIEDDPGRRAVQARTRIAAPGQQVIRFCARASARARRRQVGRSPCIGLAKVSGRLRVSLVVGRTDALGGPLFDNRCFRPSV